MPITADQLAAACQCGLPRATVWTQPINETLDAFDISTPVRAAAFLAQIAHESGRMMYVREIWGPTATQLRYEGRVDLGNTQIGDGRRFMGRGLTMITGRVNYRATRVGLRRLFPDAPDFELNPEALEDPEWAAASAGLFWQTHGLNLLADDAQFELITRRINGGLNGQSDRLLLWSKAKAALGVHP